jgi:hypothetical protein
LLEALSADWTRLKVPFNTVRAEEVMLKARKNIVFRIRNYKADDTLQFFTSFFMHL